MPNSPVSLKDVFHEWWKISKLKEHFYVRDDAFGFHINCKCPVNLDSMNRDMQYSGVTFVWFQDGRVLSRPDEFWLSQGPVEKLNIKDPEFFQKLEALCGKLHDFFASERTAFAAGILKPKSGGQ